jgi:predicted P-loop ATPase
MSNSFQMPEVSFYKNVKDTTGKTRPIGDIIKLILSNNKTIIEKIRSVQDKRERNRLKNNLPGFAASGTFSKRKADCLIKHSGLIQIDIDDVNNVENIKAHLVADKFTFLCFTSPSGNGIKLLVKIEAKAESHLQSFQELELYYKSIYGITIDPSTKDLSRLCFLSYDPNLYYNKDSALFTCTDTVVNNDIQTYTAENTNVNAKMPRKQLNTTEIQQFESKLEQIEQKQLDITKVYQDWLNIGFAISHAFGERGRTYYHRLSRINPQYSEQICNTQYTKCLNSSGSGITISTFYKFANDAIKTLEKSMQKNKTIFHITEEELSKSYSLRFNTMKVAIEIKKKGEKKWEECNESQLYIDLNKKGIRISESKLHALLKSNFVTRYDPILEYFEDLEPWKIGDKDYITELIDHISTDKSKEIRYNFKKWLVRCIKCALIPNYFNKQAFILVHKEQNSGKSTFCRNLCPAGLEAFLRDDLPDNKDAKIALASNFIINLDELANLNKKDVDQLKTYFSTSTIKERLPYDRKPTTLPRRANFIGSTNNSEFLVDSSGSVRWLCFEITKINWDYKKNIDIDKVWSQAYALSKDENFDCEFTEEDIAQNEKRNSKFQIISSEEDLLRKYFELEENAEQIDSNFFSATDIISYLGEMSTGVRLSPVKMGKVLAKLNIKKHQHSAGIGRGYYLKKKEV